MKHSRSEAADKRVRQLYRLARLHGVETAYRDVHGQLSPASPEGLTEILRALGAPLGNAGDIPAAWRERRQANWRRMLAPIIVTWDGAAAEVELRLPSAQLAGRAECHLQLESGASQSWRLDRRHLRTLKTAEVEGARFVAKKLTLGRVLPWGYHRLTIEMPGAASEALVISAPTRAYEAPEDVRSRAWGVFLPLYALCSERSWGAGDLTDLEALLEWTNRLGGSAIATLPLLATFLDTPFDPSPYAPVSRLFWNEFYLDVERIPELGASTSAQACMSSPGVQNELRALRSGHLVDYGRALAAKRKIIEHLARSFFGEGDGLAEAARDTGREPAFREFLVSHPLAEDYARFRAVCEREGRPWTEWPEPSRSGTIQTGDYDEAVKRYHLYAQWATDEQFGALAEKARQNPPGLCLDLPLGLHPAGYDVWRHRDSYVPEVSAGAPPDIVFTGGQNWGFPPLHPETRRQKGHRYYIDCLRHQLERAGLVRIDHVMGLHRLFWIPKGHEPAHGAYVRYPAEELYAILCLESHRHKSLIVGENLGTVPRYVNPTMARHNIKRMYVVQYALSGQDQLHPVYQDSVASLNTHDMPPFRAFWEGLDIEDRRSLGFLTERSATEERKLRASVRKSMIAFFKRRGQLKHVADAANSKHAGPEVVRAFLEFLSASPSELVLINLEDLWLESEPQNVPGTSDQRPNWRRKARHRLEAFRQMPQVLDTLTEVKRLRKRAVRKQKSE